METIDDLPPSAQNRNTFRTSLLPSEIGISRFWIHDPGIDFSDGPVSPVRYVLLLEEGVSLLNVSAGGTLIRIASPPEIGLLRLVTQPIPEEEKNERRGQVPFRDVSMVMRMDLRKDLRDILVSCKIVRATMVRTTTKSTLYELAVRFYAWGNLTGSTAQWYKVRDSSVPPVAAWITRRQLAKSR
jgi:hypothetical protein